jgi:hypothetical protein
LQKKEEKADRTPKLIKNWRTAKINILVLALEGIIDEEAADDNEHD